MMPRAAFVAMALLATPLQAATLAPVTGHALDGIPLAQAMATMEVLGEWRLLSGGQIKLMQAMTRNGGECGVGGLDDANICGRFTLFVSANGELSVPVDFVLFRLPETLGWKLPKDARPDSDYGKFSIRLSACEMKKTATGFGWKGTSYLLRVKEDLDTDGHFIFHGDLDKTPGERPDCAA